MFEHRNHIDIISTNYDWSSIDNEVLVAVAVAVDAPVDHGDLGAGHHSTREPWLKHGPPWSTMSFRSCQWHGWYLMLPSGNLTWLLKMAIYSGFSH